MSRPYSLNPRNGLRRETSREDCDGRGDPTSHSWDVGICLSDTPASFITPEIRIDTKAKRRSGRDESGRQKEGVLRLGGDVYGIDDPAKIVWSCILEHDGEVPERIAALPLIGSEALNGITQKIWDRSQEFHAAQT